MTVEYSNNKEGGENKKVIVEVFRGHIKIFSFIEVHLGYTGIDVWQVVGSQEKSEQKV